MQINLARTVAAHPLAVFATVADIVNWPMIIRSVISVELLTPGTIRAGTQLRERRIMFGLDTTEELEVIDIQRPHRLRLAAGNRDIRYELDHVIDALFEAGARLTLIFRTRPVSEVGQAATPFITPFMEIKLRDELEQDLADLAAAVRATRSPARERK
jgi:hypothetical protein